MTSKIAEIRARHQRIETTDDALLVNLEFSWANDDRGWLLAEVERLREALALGSEVLASHQGTLKREWHNVGAWLYAGDTINVVRAPLPEIAAPESAEGDR